MDNKINITVINLQIIKIFALKVWLKNKQATIIKSTNNTVINKNTARQITEHKFKQPKIEASHRFPCWKLARGDRANTKFGGKQFDIANKSKHHSEKVAIIIAIKLELIILFFFDREAIKIPINK